MTYPHKINPINLKVLTIKNKVNQMHRKKVHSLCNKFIVGRKKIQQSKLKVTKKPQTRKQLSKKLEEIQTQTF